MPSTGYSATQYSVLVLSTRPNPVLNLPIGPSPIRRSPAPAPHACSRLGAAVDTELAQDPVHVILDRLLLDGESLCDLLVRKALVDQSEHLGLARSQAASLGRIGRLGYQPADATDQTSGDLGRCHELPASHARNGRRQILDRALRSDATRDTGLDPIDHLLLRHPDGDELHGGIGDRRRREPDVLRHWSVEYGYV